ncbi:MAG TPA: permease-like cell division protein FtsX [Chthonomonadales bacterium]|nr:permease-like cell division protein FtsX [Chthonomonadales bacterium]
MRSLPFLVAESLRNIKRNGLMSLAALGTITVALTVLGGSIWAANRIREIADRQPRAFNQIDLFLKVNTDRQGVANLGSQLRSVSGVAAVRLVSREQAWAQMQSQEPKLTAAIPDNPLPDKYEVTASDPALIKLLAQRFRDKSRFPQVAQVNDAGEEVRTMLGFSRVIRVLGVAAALGLFVATLFIVHNTIRLTVFARRREIRIMQLVGATPGFIRFPLLLEGVIYGITGAVAAAGIVIFCGWQVSQFVSQLRSPLVGSAPSLIGPREVVCGLLLLGGVIGLFGGHLAIRRFLRPA